MNGSDGSTPNRCPVSDYYRAAVGLTPQQHAGLTARQREVLALVANGYTNPAIARKLGITNDTVKTHTRRILHKLNAKDRAHAVAEGFRKGVLQ